MLTVLPTAKPWAAAVIAVAVVVLPDAVIEPVALPEAVPMV